MRADEYINLALERTKARVRVNDLVTGLLALLAFILVYLLAVIVADQTLQFDRSLRLWLLVILGVVAAAGLTLILMWPSIKHVNDLFAARLIERQADDQFRNSLVTYVQSCGDSRLGPDVRGAIEAKAARDLGHIDVDLVVNRRPLRIAVASLLAAVIVMLCFAVMSRKDFGTSLYRALGADVAPPTSTRIIEVRTDPRGPTVIAGTNLRVIVSTADLEPKTVELKITRGGKYKDAQAMQSVATGTWETVVENLLEDVVFDVRAGDARSDGHSVRVQPLPAIVDVETVLTYPAYTLRPSQRRPTGNVEALRGTKVEVIAHTNQPPGEADLVFGDGTRKLTMQIAERASEARGGFTVKLADTYHIQFVDASMTHANAGAVRYQVTPLADQPPEVQLDRAGSEVHVPAGGKLQLDVLARDDFGLAALTAHWQPVQPGDNAETDSAKAGKASQSALRTVEADKAVPAIEGRFELAVASMGLKEGDQALVWVSASDRLPGTPQEGRSAPMRVIIDPPGKSEGAGGDSSQTQQGSTAGTGASSSQQKTAGLSPRERQQLEKFEQAVEKSRQKPQQSPEGGQGNQSAGQQPSGSGNDPAKGDPSEPSDQGSGGQDAGGDSSTQNPNGNPSESSSTQTVQRNPDQEPDSRRTQFDESGQHDAATAETQLLRTVGPEIRRVAQELRRGTIDPALLKELGWSETELQQFVRAWQDDDRFDRASQDVASSGSATVSRTQSNTDITAARGQDGALGGGSSRSVGENDQMSENVEAAAQRTSPRYRSQVEAYLKSINDAETSQP